jgi:hypothetical protein
MVRTNPIPEGLRGRPFSEQVEALPAREALRAVLSEAPGFRDETPDPVTFATGLLPLANAIFRGDRLYSLYTVGSWSVAQLTQLGD